MVAKRKLLSSAPGTKKATTLNSSKLTNGGPKELEGPARKRGPRASGGGAEEVNMGKNLYEEDFILLKLFCRWYLNWLIMIKKDWLRLKI